MCASVFPSLVLEEFVHRWSLATPSALSGILEQLGIRTVI